jgi:hypothetical protein
MPTRTMGVSFRTLLILFLCLAPMAAFMGSPVQQGRLPSHECCYPSAKPCCQQMPCMVGRMPVFDVMLMRFLLQLWHVNEVNTSARLRGHSCVACM